MLCAKLNRSSFIPKGGEPLFLLIMSGQTAPFVYINHFPAILHSITCGAGGETYPGLLTWNTSLKVFWPGDQTRCPAAVRLSPSWRTCSTSAGS